MFFPCLAGFLAGIAVTIIGFMFYIDTDLKPRLRDVEYELGNLKRKWDCSWELASRLSEVAITDKQKAAAASSAAVIRSVVQEALNKA